MSALGDALRDGGQWIVLAAAVLGAVVYIVRAVWRAYRTVTHFVDRIERALVAVEVQLYPNGNTSLRDAVDRIQAHLGIENTPPAGGPNLREAG